MPRLNGWKLDFENEKRPVLLRGQVFLIKYLDFCWGCSIFVAYSLTKNRKQMKKLMVIAVLMVSALAVNAQDYNWAIGVRGGWENAGLTLKKGMGGTALDFTGTWDFRSDFTRLKVQGLYEWQQPLADGLDWYYGLGAHVGLL